MSFLVAVFFNFDTQVAIDWYNCAICIIGSIHGIQSREKNSVLNCFCQYIQWYIRSLKVLKTLLAFGFVLFFYMHFPMQLKVIFDFDQ